MNNEFTATAETALAVRRSRRHTMMHFLMFLTTVCWAANMVAIKDALQGFTPLALAQIRVLGAACLFGGIYAGWRGRPTLKLVRGEWRGMLLLALTGVALNQLFFIGGLSRTTVAHAGLIVALGPVLVLVLACLLGMESLTVPKLVGMLISFAGVAILTAGKVGQQTNPNWRGDLIVLAASTVFAFYTIQVKKVADRIDAITLNTVSYAIGAVLVMPFAAPAVLKTRWDALRAPILWAVVYVIVFGSVVPYTLYTFAMLELSASRVAAFSYLQPVIASALGLWLLEEKLTRTVVVGGILILLGVFLTEREWSREGNA